MFWRILYRAYRITTWLRHFAVRRFTRTGLFLVGGLMMMAMVGADTENTVAYQGFALLLALLLLSIFSRLSFRLRFVAARNLPRFGTVGQPFRYRVSIQNLSSQTQRGLTLLDDLADPRPAFPEWREHHKYEAKHSHSIRIQARRRLNPFRVATTREAELAVVPPGQSVDVGIELKPLRRGVLRFTGVTLARPDPLNLFRAFSRVFVPQSALILPHRYTLPPIELPGSMKYQEGGVAMASQVGQSDEFVALREYRRGDPLRHIHWRSWAKAGKPIVKEFQDEFFVRHALVLDTFTDQEHGELFEEAVSVAASFAATVRTQESLLDLLFVGAKAFTFTAGRGLAHADQMLEILASVRPCGDKAISTLEHLLVGHIGVVSGCVFVLLGWDQVRQDLVKKTRRMGVPVLVLVIAVPGQAKWLLPGPMQDEPHRFHVLELGRVEEGLSKLS